MANFLRTKTTKQFASYSTEPRINNYKAVALTTEPQQSRGLGRKNRVSKISKCFSFGSENLSYFNVFNATLYSERETELRTRQFHCHKIQYYYKYLANYLFILSALFISEANVRRIYSEARQHKTCSKQTC